MIKKKKESKHLFQSLPGTGTGHNWGYGTGTYIITSLVKHNKNRK